MVYGAICKESKSPLYFFEDGERENQENYENIISSVLLPWANDFYPEGSFVYYQDNARPHIGKKVMEYLKSKISFIPVIPPYSPDFNPIENVWSIVKNKVEKMQPKDLGDLKEKMIVTWEELDQKLIKNCIKSTQERLKEIYIKQGEFV